MKLKMNRNIIGSLILGLAALVWGLSFTMQSMAADKQVPAFQLNGVRMLIGGVALSIVYAILQKSQRKPVIPPERTTRRRLLIGGLVCGLFLAVSVNFQNFGIVYYPDGVAAEARASFLTALYVILVPIFSVFLGKKLSPAVVVAVGVVTVGVYLLCLSNGLSGFYLADFLVLICAFTFAGHILSVDRFGDGLDALLLSILQFFVCGIVSMILSLIFEPFSWEIIYYALPQILYMGLGSTGVGYTLQTIGQKYASPSVASITMSLECVFGAIFGWLVLGNALSVREIIGCALVFTAIVLAQIPMPNPLKKKETEETL